MVIKDIYGKVLFQNETDKIGVTELDGVDLRQANLKGYDFEAIMIDGNDMRGADLSGASLYWCVVLNANLEGANLASANLQGVSFNHVNLRRANLTAANFGPSNIGSPSCLYGTDFREANVTNTIFSGAWYDDNTSFPNGFDPQAQGMVFVKSAE